MDRISRFEYVGTDLYRWTDRNLTYGRIDKERFDPPARHVALTHDIGTGHYTLVVDVPGPPAEQAEGYVLPMHRHGEHLHAGGPRDTHPSRLGHRHFERRTFVVSGRSTSVQISFDALPQEPKRDVDHAAYPDVLIAQAETLRGIIGQIDNPCCDDPGCASERLALAFRDLAGDMTRNARVAYAEAQRLRALRRMSN